VISVERTWPKKRYARGGILLKIFEAMQLTDSLDSISIQKFDGLPTSCGTMTKRFNVIIPSSFIVKVTSNRPSSKRLIEIIDLHQLDPQ
jgi:hypothetical protein